MPYTPESGATKIQSVWRGYKTRKAITRAPLTASPSSFLTIIVGNDPAPVFPAEKKLKGHFVFVGTGALANLRWIKEMADVSLISQDGYTHIPKLFVVDNSRFVIQFWQLMKNIMGKAKNLNEFTRCSMEMRSQLRKICHRRYEQISLVLLSHITLLTDNSEEWYRYFRNVICKMSIVCEDWGNREVFNYIKSVTAGNVPIVAYASNIIEYVAADYNNDSLRHFQRIFTNIESLDPLYTIHTRMSMESVLRKMRQSGGSFGIFPDTQLLFNKDQSAGERLAALEDKGLLSLYELPRPEQMQAEQPGKTCNLI